MADVRYLSVRNSRVYAPFIRKNEIKKPTAATVDKQMTLKGIETSSLIYYK